MLDSCVAVQLRLQLLGVAALVRGEPLPWYRHAANCVRWCRTFSLATACSERAQMAVDFTLIRQAT